MSVQHLGPFQEQHRSPTRATSVSRNINGTSRLSPPARSVRIVLQNPLIPPNTAHDSSSIMPTALGAAPAALLTLTTVHPDAQAQLPTTNGRPRTENGLLRRNSDAHHQRPSSAPSDNQHDLGQPGTKGLDSRGTQPTARPAKPPLLRAKSEHPSRPRDSSADSSNDEQTIVAAPEDFGTRHGFDGHYQSEDIISQLANVGAFSTCPYAARYFVAARLHMSRGCHQALLCLYFHSCLLPRTLVVARNTSS